MLQAAGIIRTTPLSLPSKGYSFATWLRLEGGTAKGTSSLFSLLLRGAELKGVAAAFTGVHRWQHVRLTLPQCCQRLTCGASLPFQPAAHLCAFCCGLPKTQMLLPYSLVLSTSAGECVMTTQKQGCSNPKSIPLAPSPPQSHLLQSRRIF